jgi:transmembrane sensor
VKMSAQPSRAIGAEAAAWFVEFRSGEPDGAARAQFLEWLAQSPQHIQAYLEVSGAWADLPARDPERRIDISGLIDRARAEPDVVTPAHWKTSAPTERDIQARHRIGRRGVRVAIAAAALVCVLALSWMSVTQRGEAYVTGIGEQRTLHLADTSEVELNTRSEVRVRLLRHRRDLVLAAGEALFHVAKDPQRPFIVHAGDLEIRAVGTEFDVYRKPAATLVTVVEGRISVRRANPGNGQSTTPLEIPAGEQSIITANGMSMPRVVNTDDATAWIHRQLRFEETPLSEVAAELNRYNTRPLTVESAELQDLKISGLYSSTDPTSLLNFLRAQPSITVTETEKGTRISRR